MKRSVILMGWAVLVLPCWMPGGGAALGDVIHLKNGRLDGEVIERSGGRIKIRTDAGIVTTVDEKDVVSIEERESPAAAYRTAAAKIAPDDAAGHYALSLWCRDHGLKEEQAGELAAVLKIDPNHAAARADLGFEKTDSGWLARDEAMRAKGMVQVDGQWMTKEEADRLGNVEKMRRLVRAINATVAKIHSSPNGTNKELEEKLSELNDPAGGPRMTELLEDRSPVVRRVACLSLGAMGFRPALPALVQKMLMDPKDTVQEAALAAASRIDAKRTRDFLHDMIAGLKLQPITDAADQRAARRIYYQIAWALGTVGDLESVPFLIEILYPRVAVTGPPTGGTGFGLSRSGTTVSGDNVIFGTGAPPPEPVGDEYYFNSAAETALKKLTGQDLGVLPKAWRDWWKSHGAELLRKAEAQKRGAAGADTMIERTGDGAE